MSMFNFLTYQPLSRILLHTLPSDLRKSRSYHVMNTSPYPSLVQPPPFPNLNQNPLPPPYLPILPRRINIIKTAKGKQTIYHQPPLPSLHSLKTAKSRSSRCEPSIHMVNMLSLSVFFFFFPLHSFFLKVSAQRVHGRAYWLNYLRRSRCWEGGRKEEGRGRMRIVFDYKKKGEERKEKG